MAAPSFALAAFAAVLACCCAGQTDSSNTAIADRAGIALRNMRGIVATILVFVPEAAIHENRPVRWSFRSFLGFALSPISCS
jgi:hypothetical protein